MAIRTYLDPRFSRQRKIPPRNVSFVRIVPQYRFRSLLWPVSGILDASRSQHNTVIVVPVADPRAVVIRSRLTHAPKFLMISIDSPRNPQRNPKPRAVEDSGSKKRSFIETQLFHASLDPRIERHNRIKPAKTIAFLRKQASFVTSLAAWGGGVSAPS